jgi:shikimate kinase
MSDYRLKGFDGSFYISGFMGAGKSVIGSLFAQKLELPFHDLDKYLVQKERKNIQDIFKEDGEQYFREKEWEYLLDLTRSFKGVIALGGGALQNQNIVDHLKVNGLLIYIDTPMEVILDRILRNPKRPIVRNELGEIKSRETLKIELETLYSSRIEFYKQAEVELITSGNEKKEIVVNRLIDKIKKHV